MNNFIISLDFELHWGVFDVMDNKYNDNILGAREAIEKMLIVFQKYDMHVTWAVVGLLFNENKEDYKKYKPSLFPSYEEQNLNSYNCDIGENEVSDPLHYAHSIIKLIKSYPNQEIASHSYSHYYCKENGQTIGEFEEDIISAIKIAKDKFNIDLKSFIFPRNEVNYDYLSILKKYGFTGYRGNPDHWIYKDGHKTNIYGRVIRLFDSYINLTGYKASDVISNEGLLNVKGDRFLRPYKNKLINRFMLRRIKNEMKYAAKNSKNYHLWWHPHNFGTKTSENIDNLENILIYYNVLKIKYNMESLCMQDLQ